jgi:hypothetical protein
VRPAAGLTSRSSSGPSIPARLWPVVVLEPISICSMSGYIWPARAASPASCGSSSPVSSQTSMTSLRVTSLGTLSSWCTGLDLLSGWGPLHLRPLPLLLELVPGLQDGLGQNLVSFINQMDRITPKFLQLSHLAPGAQSCCSSKAVSEGRVLDVGPDLEHPLLQPLGKVRLPPVLHVVFVTTTALLHIPR